MFPLVTFHLSEVEECASTQEELLAFRGRPDFHGTALLAGSQTSGRGRRGRSWESAKGNLFLSFGLELTDDTVLTLLPFACGLALHAAAGAYLPPEARLRLKWPNDLYLNDRKLAGMLAQGRSVPGGGSEVVVGVGLNLRHAPEDLEVPATALAEHCAAPEPRVFAEKFLGLLEGVFLEASDFHRLRTAWERAAELSETELTIVGENLRVSPQALLSTGELLVRVSSTGELRRLASEEVSVRLV